jgi:hypothetical protein
MRRRHPPPSRSSVARLNANRCGKPFATTSTRSDALHTRKRATLKRASIPISAGRDSTSPTTRPTTAFIITTTICTSPDREPSTPSAAKRPAPTPLGNTVTTAYDALGRPVAATGAAYGYAAAGRPRVQLAGGASLASPASLGLTAWHYDPATGLALDGQPVLKTAPQRYRRGLKAIHSKAARRIPGGTSRWQPMKRERKRFRPSWIWGSDQESARPQAGFRVKSRSA